MLKSIVRGGIVAKGANAGAGMKRSSMMSSSFASPLTGSLMERGPVLGASVQVTHAFTQDTVNAFADICGDNNPLHIDPSFAVKTQFKGTIVHGILVSSLFSTLFGRAINGSIYVSQTLSFKRPVHVGVPVTARMEIVQVEEKRSGLLITCSTTVVLPPVAAGGGGGGGGAGGGEVVAVTGEAKVLLPKSSSSQ